MLITTAVLSKLVIFGIGVVLSQKVLDSNTVADKPGLESEAEVGPLFPCRPTHATSTAFASLSAAASGFSCCNRFSLCHVASFGTVQLWDLSLTSSAFYIPYGLTPSCYYPRPICCSVALVTGGVQRLEKDRKQLKQIRELDIVGASFKQIMVRY